MSEVRLCERCEHCERVLRKWVWLELSCVTGKWYMGGDCPDGESQGMFKFGLVCARRKLKESGTYHGKLFDQSSIGVYGD